MAKIGVLGGTFDPVHFGHVVPTKQVLEEFNLDKVLFIPTGNPNFKQGEVVATKKDRLAMLELALKNYDAFEVDSCEIDRAGVTYSVDTFEELALKHPNDDLFFIVGTDCTVHINSWKNAQRLSELCSLIVTARCGFSFDDVCSAQKNNLFEHGFCFEYEFAHTKMLDISSTEIRARVRCGKSIDELCFQEVVDYIYKNNLYGQFSLWCWAQCAHFS